MTDPFKALEAYCAADVKLADAYQTLEHWRSAHPDVALAFIATGEYFSRLNPWERIYALHLASTTKASLERAAATVLFEKLVVQNFDEIEKRVLSWIANDIDFEKGGLVPDIYAGFARGGYVHKNVDGSSFGVHTNEYIPPKGWSNGRLVMGKGELHFRSADGNYKQIDVQINSGEPIHGEPGPEGKAGFRPRDGGTFTGRLVENMIQMRRGELPEQED